MSEAAVFEEAAPIEPPPKCRHVDCGRPGTVETKLRGRRGRRVVEWLLYHCKDHREDGPRVAQATGFAMVRERAAVERGLEPVRHLTVVP